jgi:hypothetical protein
MSIDTTALRRGLAGLVAVAGVAALAGPAVAIECRGPYQVVSGNLLATPYCGDNYLASVARGYGTRVTNEEVRNNPSVKEQVCLHIGHDNRVSDICHSYRDRGGPRF